MRGDIRICWFGVLLVMIPLCIRFATNPEGVRPMGKPIRCVIVAEGDIERDVVEFATPAEAEAFRAGVYHGANLYGAGSIHVFLGHIPFDEEDEECYSEKWLAEIRKLLDGEE